MNQGDLAIPAVWQLLIILLLLLFCILIIIKGTGWLKDHTGRKITMEARLIDKHENSAPIHQGGISSQSMTVSFSFIFETAACGRMEFKVNSQTYAAHEINETGKIIIQGKRLVRFIR